MTGWITPVILNNDFDRRLAEPFLMFDFVGDQTVESTNIGSILRFLGCVPSDSEIAEFIKQTEYLEGRIHLSKFLAVLYKWLIEDRMKPASITELSNAFKLFDSVGDACIDKNDFIDKLKELGDNLTDEEFHNMMTISMDPNKLQIFYEYYIKKILHDPENSIYDKAKEMEAIKQATQAAKAAKNRKAGLVPKE